MKPTETKTSDLKPAGTQSTGTQSTGTAVAEPPPGKASTREALLDAAEALFAERGIAGTSLRAVTGRAAANLAAVSYHFGSKEGLVREVFHRRLAPVSAQRLDLLDLAQAEAAPEAASVSKVIEAFLAPVLRMGDGHPERTRNFKRLMARTLSEPGDEMSKIVKEQFREVGRRFLEAFQEALPEIPPDVLMWRFHFMIGSMVQVTLNGALIERHTEGLCDPSDIPGLSARLVEFLSAGFQSAVDGYRAPVRAKKTAPTGTGSPNSADIDAAGGEAEARPKEESSAESSSIFPWEDGF